MMETEELTTKVNGIELCYALNGPMDGDPLLLIMGLGAQLIGWPIEFVEHLASQGFRVIRFDNRDSGLSTKSAGDPPAAMDLLAKALNGESIESPYSLSTMADDAVALLEFYGLPVGAHCGRINGWDDCPNLSNRSSDIRALPYQHMFDDWRR